METEICLLLCFCASALLRLCASFASAPLRLYVYDTQGPLTWSIVIINIVISSDRERDTGGIFLSPYAADPCTYRRPPTYLPTWLPRQGLAREVTTDRGGGAPRKNEPHLDLAIQRRQRKDATQGRNPEMQPQGRKSNNAIQKDYTHRQNKTDLAPYLTAG